VMRKRNRPVWVIVLNLGHRFGKDTGGDRKVLGYSSGGCPWAVLSARSLINLFCAQMILCQAVFVLFGLFFSVSVSKLKLMLAERRSHVRHLSAKLVIRNIGMILTQEKMGRAHSRRGDCPDRHHGKNQRNGAYATDMDAMGLRQKGRRPMARTGPRPD